MTIQRRGCGRALSLAAAAALFGGCESVIPRRDLQAMARTLPPSPAVSAEERDAMTRAIRAHSGVANFEFSPSEFTPETRLPPGTQWILGLFIGN